jgi:hypothetical protein
MDLNINNYSVEELYKLFNITDNKIDIIKIEDYLVFKTMMICQKIKRN